QEANEGQNDLDTTTADGYDRMTFKNLMDDVAEEKADLDDFEAVIEDPAYLNYIPYQTETIDIDVITSTMLGEEEATDDMEEFFAEHSDGHSFIRFDLDDNPIRALKVPTE